MVKMVKGSPGLNFGSVHLGAGFTTWPPGATRTARNGTRLRTFSLSTRWCKIPDRRASKSEPLGAVQIALGVCDHEQAFSFLALPIVGGERRSRGRRQTMQTPFRFLEQHIFYQSLRGGRLNLGPFQEKLGALTDEQIQAYADGVPAEWE